MTKNLKKTRDLMFKRCHELLSAAVCYLNQMQNAIDLDYDEEAERKRLMLFQRIADSYMWLNSDYIRDMDMASDFEICSALFKEVYTMFYNFKF